MGQKVYYTGRGLSLDKGKMCEIVAFTKEAQTDKDMAYIKQDGYTNRGSITDSKQPLNSFKAFVTSLVAV